MNRDEQGVSVRTCDGLAAIPMVNVPVQDQHLVVLLHRSHLSDRQASQKICNSTRSRHDTPHRRPAVLGSDLCACGHAEQPCVSIVELDNLQTHLCNFPELMPLFRS